VGGQNRAGGRPVDRTLSATRNGLKGNKKKKNYCSHFEKNNGAEDTREKGEGREAKKKKIRGFDSRDWVPKTSIKTLLSCRPKPEVGDRTSFTQYEGIIKNAKKGKESDRSPMRHEVQQRGTTGVRKRSARGGK